MKFSIEEFEKNKYRIRLYIDKYQKYYNSAHSNSNGFSLYVCFRLININFWDFIDIMKYNFNSIQYRNFKVQFYFDNYEDAKNAKEWIESKSVMNQLRKE
ncbi:MAG: hypothetical protein ACOCP8_07845 [archaeon]